MDIIGVGDGTFKCRSVRRTASPWRRKAIASLAGGPWSSKSPAAVLPVLDSPLPMVQEGPEEGGKEEGDYLPSEAGSDPPSPEGDPSSEHPEEEEEEVDGGGGVGLSDQEGAASSTGGSGSSAGMDADAEREAAPKRDADQEPPEQSPSKVARPLYPPHYAGRVQEETDDVLWEQDVLDLTTDVNLEDDEEYEDGEEDEEKPPSLPEGELESLDAEACMKEVQKLRELGVVQEVSPEEVDPNCKFLDVKNVLDWRRRPDDSGVMSWQRRCRIVAREFRSGAASTVETFSPTSGFGAVRLFFLLHLHLGWHMMSLDVGDAFLMVEQIEKVYAEVPAWVCGILGLVAGTQWMLKRVLPGQRNAAERWFGHLC